jgi:hypothetical protein
MFARRFYYFSVDDFMELETSPPGPPRMEVAARRHMVVSTRSTESSHLVDNAGELMMVHRMLVTEDGETRWRYDMYRVDLGTRTRNATTHVRSASGTICSVYLLEIRVSRITNRPSHLSQTSNLDPRYVCTIRYLLPFQSFTHSNHAHTWILELGDDHTRQLPRRRPDA